MCCSDTYPMLAVTAGGMLGLAAQFLLEVLEVRCNWRGRRASNRGWVWQRNGPNTRKQPPGNRNRNAQQTIKARRVAEEGSSNDSTVQQSSTQHTQRARRGLAGGGGLRWFIKTRACGVGRPGLTPPANHAQRPHRTGAGVGREATKLPRYSVRSHRTTLLGPLLPGVVLPILYPVHRRRGKGKRE